MGDFDGEGMESRNSWGVFHCKIYAPSKLYMSPWKDLLTVARKVPESSIVKKNSVSTPAIFTNPAPTEQISTIAVRVKKRLDF